MDVVRELAAHGIRPSRKSGDYERGLISGSIASHWHDGVEIARQMGWHDPSPEHFAVVAFADDNTIWASQGALDYDAAVKLVIHYLAGDGASFAAVAPTPGSDVKYISQWESGASYQRMIDEAREYHRING